MAVGRRGDLSSDDRIACFTKQRLIATASLIKHRRDATTIRKTTSYFVTGMDRN